MSYWTAVFFALSIGGIAYIRKQQIGKQEMEKFKSTLSDKTKEALQKAIDEKDVKTQKWIETAIERGYEGVGVIPYIYDPGAKVFRFVLGINKKGEAEYPGGKVEKFDIDKIDTVRRELTEETSLNIDRDRFLTTSRSFEINGGTTGYPSYVFLVSITEDEFKQMQSGDGTFSSFIQVLEIIDCETVVDEATDFEYQIRKFNKKYVLPQIKEDLLTYMSSVTG